MDDGTIEFRVSLIASRTPGDGKKGDDGVEEYFQEAVIGDKSERGVVVVVKRCEVTRCCLLRIAGCGLTSHRRATVSFSRLRPAHLPRVCAI